MDLADEVRTALAQGEPLGDAEARDLLVRLVDALEDAEDRLAEADLPARRAEADEMVDEARRARDRILRDLARRRHEARREVAQLQAGRDRLLETFAHIRGTIDASTRELNLALAEARLRAGEAGREIDREDLPTAAALDAELELARLAKLPLVAREDEPEPEPIVEAPDPGLVRAEPVRAADEQDAPPGSSEAAEPPESGAAEAAEAADRPGDEESSDEETSDDDTSEDTSPLVSDGAGAEDERTAGRRRRTKEPVAALVEDHDDGPPPDEGEHDDEPTEVERIEQRAAQRLKRVLADEQNEVLDRLRQRDRRRTLTVDLLLGGDLDRIARYRDALVAVLADAGDQPAHSEAVASDAAEAIVRGTRTRVEALLDEAVDGRAVDEDRVVDGVRACFREWKTQWLVRLAADSVALASAGRAETA